MNRQQLIDHIKGKKNYLCIGLDTDPNKLPLGLKRDISGVIEFNQRIIQATADYCVSYKINTAFYESMGAAGWEAMQETVRAIPETHFRIADAKRGDIGNTTEQYARAFFEHMNFDAVTLQPYMGRDSILPFLSYENKWAIILALTSNKSAEDFETMPLTNGRKLFEEVILQSAQWGNKGNTMYVTGATRAELLSEIRKIIPEHFLLIPGVGTQGGSLPDVHQHGHIHDIGMLVNVSRAVIYAGQGEDFAEKAAEAAKEYCREMGSLLS